MSSSEPERNISNLVKDSSETDDIDISHSSPDQMAVDSEMQPTTQPFEKSDSEQTTGFTVSSPVTSSTAYQDELQNTKEVRKISETFASTKLSSPIEQPSTSLCPENTKVILRLAKADETKTCDSITAAQPRREDLVRSPPTKRKTDDSLNIEKPLGSKNSAELSSKTRTGDDSNIERSSGSKDLTLSSLKKKKNDENLSIPGPSTRSAAYHTLELPLSRRKIGNKFGLPEACKFFLSFIKTQRLDLKFKESQLDCCTTEIQKAIRDAEQVRLKLQAETEVVPETMSEAITQSSKLEYLLSVSHRSFEKLDKCGTDVVTLLRKYSEDEQNFQLSVDRLFEYIVGTIVKKCDYEKNS